MLRFLLITILLLVPNVLVSQAATGADTERIFLPTCDEATATSPARSYYLAVRCQMESNEGFALKWLPGSATATLKFKAAENGLSFRAYWVENDTPEDIMDDIADAETGLIDGKPTEIAKVNEFIAAKFKELDAALLTSIGPIVVQSKDDDDVRTLEIGVPDVGKAIYPGYSVLILARKDGTITPEFTTIARAIVSSQLYSIIATVLLAALFVFLFLKGLEGRTLKWRLFEGPNGRLSLSPASRSFSSRWSRSYRR